MDNMFSNTNTAHIPIARDCITAIKNSGLTTSSYSSLPSSNSNISIDSGVGTTSCSSIPKSNGIDSGLTVSCSSLPISRLSSLESVKIRNKEVHLVRPCKAKYICQICRQLLNDPIQTVRGELACKDCYQSRKRTNGLCPIDGEAINDAEIFSDKSMSREINKLECTCLNEKYGCTWIGALGDIYMHEESCEYRDIKCSSCGTHVTSNRLNEHQERECLYRHERCQYCDTRIIYAEMEVHEERCINKPSPCPFKCDEILKAGEVHLHVEKCKNIRDGVICPYNGFGCTYQPSHKDKLEGHFVTDSIPHIGLVINTFNFMKNEASALREELNQEKHNRTGLEHELQQLKDKMHVMSKEQEAQMRKMEELRSIEKEENHHKEVYNRVKVLEDFMSDFQSENDKSMQKLLSMQTEIDKIVPSKDLSNYVQDNKALVQVKDQMDRYETELAQCVSQVADLGLNLQLVENTTYDGRLIWKIDNFAYRTRQAEIGKVTVLHSAPCFTKKFEYKFCGRLYLNGDGVGKCTHLSLFICFLKSPLDDQLEWPVVKKVTFRLLHPSNKEKTHSEWFITDRNSSSFKKPTKEMNIAAGCPLFMKKEDVVSEGFMVNDSIYIETHVEPFE